MTALSLVAVRDEGIAGLVAIVTHQTTWWPLVKSPGGESGFGDWGEFCKTIFTAMPVKVTVRLMCARNSDCSIEIRRKKEGKKKKELLLLLLLLLLLGLFLLLLLGLLLGLLALLGLLLVLSLLVLLLLLVGLRPINDLGGLEIN